MVESDVFPNKARHRVCCLEGNKTMGLGNFTEKEHPQLMQLEKASWEEDIRVGTKNLKKIFFVNKWQWWRGEEDGGAQNRGSVKWEACVCTLGWSQEDWMEQSVQTLERQPLAVHVLPAVCHEGPGGKGLTESKRASRPFTWPQWIVGGKMERLKYQLWS